MYATQECSCLQEILEIQSCFKGIYLILTINSKPCIYSDYRANLELVIAELLETLAIPEIHIDSDYMSDSEGAIAAMECNGKVALVVRKRLAPAIQQLIQHGLMEVNNNFFYSNKME